MKKEHLIWSDDWSEIESLAKDLKYEPEYCDLSDDELSSLAYDLNNDYLDDERINLNVPTQQEIVVIADLGLWDGRRQGYKILRRNVRECLYMSGDCLGAKWYCDAYNLHGVEHHHDGTNYYLYREKKPEVTDDAWSNFLEKLYLGKATSKDISRYTKSLLPYVKEVYGW